MKRARQTGTIEAVTKSSKKQWLVPAGLLLLSFVPVVAGAMRFAELASHPAVTPDNARFVASPIPILTHIIGGTLYATLGAFQFVPSLRRFRWHRVMGRVLVLCGIASAGSGLWMTLFNDLPATDNSLLNGIRLVVGSAVLVSLVLGVIAIRRRRIQVHRAWMMRAYAIELGAGTQVFTHFGWLLAVGTPSVFTHALLMAAGWLINLALAEWLIRRRRPRRPLLIPNLAEASA